MKNILLLALFIAFFINSSAQSTKNNFNWPDNKKAAVCLTFDDGLDCHLDVAVPLLDSFQVKGTFYCTGNSQSLQNRTYEWREITKKGHELGNHTLFHPCNGDNKNWVKEEYDLQNYSLERIQSELYTANTLLKAIDGKDKRTYAYTCSDYKVQDNIPFIDVVGNLFSAARSGGEIPESMNNVDLYFLPSWPVIDNTGDELIEYVKKARNKGTIATFMFHSVGGGYLNVSAEALRELLTYLQQNKDDYWVDTFYNVTDYISKNKK